MDMRRVAFWLTTGLFSMMFAASGAMYLTHAGPIVEGVVGQLGYPMHFLTILGIAKLLGAAALMLPVPARLKEWAYAGFTFNILGATFAHAATGDAAMAVLPLGLGGLLAASYALRPRVVAERPIEMLRAAA